MKRWIIIVVLFPFVLFGQGRMLPLGADFRDQVFIMDSAASPVFPKMDHQNKYYTGLRSNQKFYSHFADRAVNHELVELKETDNSDGKLRNYYLFITPLLNVSLGKDLTADTLNRIIQNTRGVRIEGSLNDRVFFHTSFYENQAILPDYVRNYVLSKGEFYPTSSGYSQQNAVIPGAARTKPFGDNGFDYAYAVGAVSVRLFKQTQITWGNTSSFIGSGYRSLLWSDNSVGAMNLSIHQPLGKKWEWIMTRMRGLNLNRLPNPTNGEAYYEPSSLSLNGIYFHPLPNISIGLVEAGKWYRGDSIRQVAIPALYFVPLPGIAFAQANINQGSHSLFGLDASWGFSVNGIRALVYGQAVVSSVYSNEVAVQVGARFASKKWKHNFVQVEYNSTQRIYENSNPRLNFANYNLPIGHVAGNNVEEILMRIHVEKGMWYAHSATHLYTKQQVNPQLLPVFFTSNSMFQQTFLQTVELGWMFNPLLRAKTFVQFTYRKASAGPQESSWISLGFRTDLRNHYFDF